MQAQRFGWAGIIGMLPDTHTAPAMANRLEPDVQRAFAAVLGTDDLLTDHDRYGMLRPTRRSDGSAIAGARTVDAWLHLDSNPCSGRVSLFSYANGDHCHDWSRSRLVQAFLAISDAREEDGVYISFFHFYVLCLF